MKIMITGAGGFVGSRLVSHYANKDEYEVCGVRHADLDFTDEKQVQATVLQFCPDVVVHCGAISDVGTCAKNPELSRAVNVDGTRYLARACARVGARFVFCSSDQVYFGQQELGADEAAEGRLSAGAAEMLPEIKQYEAQRAAFLRPHTEEEALSPLPLYGQHKLLAERACLEEQPDSVILRLTWMYDALTAEEYAKGRRNLATMFLEALCEQNPVLRFSETDYRSVTDVREVVRHMEEAWKLPAGIYNYGSSNDTNMYETARRVLSAFGKEELVQKAEGGNLRNLTMDTAKVEAAGIVFPDTAEGMVEFLKCTAYR